MKRLITLGLAVLVLMFTFGGMAYADYYPWGRGMANLNTATEEELAWFLGRSNVSDPGQVAQNIITYRESSGPLDNAGELINVEGIDRENMDNIRLWLKTEGPTIYDPEKVVKPHRDPFFGYWAEDYRSD